MIGPVERVVVALVLLAVAVAVAAVLERRKPAAPTQPRRYAVPTQLDRDDFPTVADRAWAVVVFTSATCDSCAAVVPKAEVLAGPEVGVVEVPYQSASDLHRRYGIDAVPTLVVADAEGVVRKSFVGNATATDLWAAVAEARDPGSSPEPDLGTGPT